MPSPVPLRSPTPRALAGHKAMDPPGQVVHPATRAVQQLTFAGCERTAFFLGRSPARGLRNSSIRGGRCLAGQFRIGHGTRYMPSVLPSIPSVPLTHPPTLHDRVVIRADNHVSRDVRSGREVMYAPLPCLSCLAAMCDCGGPGALQRRPARCRRARPIAAVLVIRQSAADYQRFLQKATFTTLPLAFFQYGD